MSEASDASAGFPGVEEYELDFSYTVHIDGPVTAHVESSTVWSHNPDIEYLVGRLRFTGKIPDSRAKWHHNYKPIDRWMRAHIFREARGLNISELHDRLHEPGPLCPSLWVHGRRSRPGSTGLHTASGHVGKDIHRPSPRRVQDHCRSTRRVRT